jgi:ABC-2 type transport system permease protein
MAGVSLFRDLWQSLRHPEFWAYSSWLEIVVRYRRTSIGLLWLFLAFGLFVLIMGWKYSYLMGRDPYEFVPYLAVGYMLWRFMVQIMGDSVSSLRHYRSYIMDGRVRLTDYMLKSMAKALFYFLFAAVIVALVIAWSPKVGFAGYASLLLTFPLLILNMFWINVCASLLGARFPDMQEILGTVLMAAFLLTPIIWDVSRLPPDSTRGALARLNPAFHMIEVVRAPVLGQAPEPVSILVVAGMIVFGWVLAALMYRRYARFVALWV